MLRYFVWLKAFKGMCVFVLLLVGVVVLVVVMAVLVCGCGVLGGRGSVCVCV